jgi:hypothetical protein
MPMELREVSVDRFHVRAGSGNEPGPLLWLPEVSGQGRIGEVEERPVIPPCCDAKPKQVRHQRSACAAGYTLRGPSTGFVIRVGVEAPWGDEQSVGSNELPKKTDQFLFAPGDCPIWES